MGMSSDSTPARPTRLWIKRLVLLLVLALVLLGIFVSSWFTFAAMGLWVGMMIAGRGACPLGMCASPPRDE